MQYDPMLPECPKKNWRDMSPKEAKAFFDWFSAHIPAKMEQLRNIVEATEGDAKKLDYSDESLVYLWRWYLDHIEIEDVPEEEIRTRCEEQAHALQELLRRKGGVTSEVTYQKFYNEAYTAFKKQNLKPPWGLIAADIGIYLGECLIKRYPDKKILWGYFTKPKLDINVNRPVLMGISGRCAEKYNLSIDSGYIFNITEDLMGLLYLKAIKSVEDNQQNERDLLKHFRHLQGYLYSPNTSQNLSEIPTMNKEDTAQYFTWFSEQILHHVRNLGMCRITDFSTESLIPVWERYLDTIETTEREEKKKLERLRLKKRAKKPMLKIYVGEIEMYEGLFTKALDISTYFAETFRRHHESEGIRWGYLTEPKTLPYVNRPVLQGFKDPANPVMDQVGLFSDLAVRVAKGDRNKDALVELYNKWDKNV